MKRRSFLATVLAPFGSLFGRRDEAVATEASESAGEPFNRFKHNRIVRVGCCDPLKKQDPVATEMEFAEFSRQLLEIMARNLDIPHHVAFRDPPEYNYSGLQERSKR